MVVLGLLLILAGVVLVLAALFSSGGTAELVGFDLNAATIFFLGVGAGAAVLWGLGLLRFGTKRSMKQRRERKELSRLSEKLEKVDAERREQGEADAGA